MKPTRYNVEASQPFSQRVVGAAFVLALRPEIVLLQQLNTVLLQNHWIEVLPVLCGPT